MRMILIAAAACIALTGTVATAGTPPTKIATGKVLSVISFPDQKDQEETGSKCVFTPAPLMAIGRAPDTTVFIFGWEKLTCTGDPKDKTAFYKAIHSFSSKYRMRLYRVWQPNPDVNEYRVQFGSGFGINSFFCCTRRHPH